MPEMEVVGDHEISDSNPRQYVIDRNELLQLRESGLIQSKLYVLLAIKLSYDTQEPSIDIPWFCQQWDLKEAEFTTALAQLQKKGALQPVARQLTLQLF